RHRGSKMMIIIAGWLQVDPSERDRYLAECLAVMRLAAAADGCLDFVLSADPADPGRIRVFERWDRDTALERFRGTGPDAAQTARIIDAQVHRYRISAVEPP
ncbi:MAG: antibiotic biosynthesis monooxygenase, partial [Pseudonocardia sp.]|nr:antibiotic biosynthesis monooxygenase [Pseudonocardia sp.]